MPGFEADFGQGHVGYVAEHPLPMDRSDFDSLPRTARRALEETPPGLRPDVVVPIEHETALLGVFIVGGPNLRQDQAKRLLKMVADLTAVALVYLTRLRTVEESADLDGLTGLYNRRALLNRLGDEIHQAQRHGQPLSVLMLDIDHFKNYNDSHGHLEGDEVLKEMGRLFKRSIREDDLAARYGGEEFVILYPGAPKDVAGRLAENLRRAVEAHSFPQGSSQPPWAGSPSRGEWPASPGPRSRSTRPSWPRLRPIPTSSPLQVPYASQGMQAAACLGLTGSRSATRAASCSSDCNRRTAGHHLDHRSDPLRCRQR